MTGFQYTFAGCTGVVTIPAGLFDNNTKVTNFNSVFYGCSAITGYLPKLWTTHPITATHNDTFTDCIQAENFDDAVNNLWATDTR